MKVLVAGASGFVGRRLSVALEEAGHDVVAMTRKPDRYRGVGTAVRGDSLSAHLRSRRQVEKPLGTGGVPVTVIRAGIIIGHGGVSWELTRWSRSS